MMSDTLHVVHARTAGVDVHKMQITASVRLCAPGAGERSGRDGRVAARALGRRRGDGRHRHLLVGAVPSPGERRDSRNPGQRPPSQTAQGAQDRRCRQRVAGASVPVLFVRPGEPRGRKDRKWLLLHQNERLRRFTSPADRSTPRGGQTVTVGAGGFLLGGVEEIHTPHAAIEAALAHYERGEPACRRAAVTQDVEGVRHHRIHTIQVTSSQKKHRHPVTA